MEKKVLNRIAVRGYCSGSRWVSRTSRPCTLQDERNFNTNKDRAAK